MPCVSSGSAIPFVALCPFAFFWTKSETCSGETATGGPSFSTIKPCVSTFLGDDEGRVSPSPPLTKTSVNLVSHPTGTEHPPSSTRSIIRSALVLQLVFQHSRLPMIARARSSPSRTSTPIAPWPTAWYSVGDETDEVMR